MTQWRGLYGIAGPLDGSTADSRERETFVAARSLLKAGARVLQLRDKSSTGHELVSRARRLRALCREAGATFIVNDRLDVALAAEADGVHVGQDDLPVEAVRSALRAAGRAAGSFVVGLSTHDDAQVREALALGVDYIGHGPVFATMTKADASPVRGLEGLKRAVSLAGTMPVVAIGGLTLDQAPALVETGVAMAAVIADIHRSPSPEERAAAWQRTFLDAAR